MLYHSNRKRHIISISPNLIVNGDFRHNTLSDFPDCWDRYLAPKYVGNIWWDTPCLQIVSDVPSGSGCLKSLKLSVPDSDLIGQIYVSLQGVVYIYSELHIGSKLHLNNVFTLSFFMKCNTDNKNVIVRWFGDSYTVSVTTEWQQFSFKKIIKNTEELLNMSLQFTPNDIGDFYITGVQLRKSSSIKKYIDSPFITRVANIPQPRFRTDFRNNLMTEYGIDYNNLPNITETPENKHVTIDPQRRCFLIDGNSYFYFAACFMRIHYSISKWDDLLTSLANHGYTAVVITVSSRWNSDRASDEQIIDFLDLAESYGLKVIIWVNPNAVLVNGTYVKIKSLPPNEQVNYYQQEINNLYNVVGSHSNFLSWYVYDEPSQDFINSGALDNIITYTRNLDSEHPIEVNYSNIWWHYQYLNDTVPVDIASQTSYPVPRKSVQLVSEHIARNYIATGYKKMSTVWLQFYCGHGRYPTPNEFICMTYLAAIYGATGFQTWPMMPSSKLLWDASKNVINEMKLLEDWLYIQQRKSVIIDNEFIDGALKQIDSNQYVFVSVNVSKQWQKTLITFDSIPAITNIVDFYDNSYFSFDGQQIVLLYKPYERKVLKIFC